MPRTAPPSARRKQPGGTRYFTELGERVDARWRDQGYADEALAAIAEEELRRRPPHEHVSPWELAQLGRHPRRMPEQGSAGFGQPPLAVWGSENMYIEVLYWLEATTAIHQHSFSGAFAVLEGSSLHTQYRFRPDHKLSNDHLHVGKLVWTSSEHLTRGSVHQIKSGPQFIHALFHLEHPSVSVVVRNYHDEGAPPPLGYMAPGVGVEHTLEPRLERALELYRMLVDIGRVRDAEQIVSGIIKDPDLMSVFCAMAAIGEAPAEREIGDRIRERARKLHGPVIDTLAEALDQREETRRFTALRSRVTDPDLRFFIALLLVVPTPAALRRLIDERVPGQDFATTVIRWLTAFAELDAFAFRLDAVQLRVIELMMRGQSLATIKKSLASTHDVRRLVQQVKDSPYLDRLVAAAGSMNRRPSRGRVA